MQHLTDRQKQAQQRITALLTELADIIGPHWDGQAEPDTSDQPIDPHPQPWEWGLVTCWQDDQGQHEYTVFGSAALLPHHMIGLLRTGQGYVHDSFMAD